MTAVRTHLTFEALGCAVHVAVRRSADLDAATRLARAVLRDVDETCSRFRDDSDLSRANRRPGRWTEVDPLLAAAVEVSLGAARATDGLVDPLLGRPLVSLGYDRDLRLVRADPSPAGPVASVRPGAWRELRVDAAGAIRVPESTALDLGATGKAFAADLVAAAFEEHLRGSAVVSVGGDLRVAAPDGKPWRVAVSEHPGAPAEAVVAVASGGVATSSTRVRRWTSGGTERHHLLDPRTGRPVDGRWRTVTAAGATCVAANTAATAALVDADALDPAVPARLVDRAGVVHVAGGWPAEPAGRRAA